MTFSPTPEQLAIVDFIRENPKTSLMVDARAGAAKTSTIVLAAAQITSRPALAVAFNKRIADELKLRLPEGFDTKTLNGLGHSAWGSAVGRLSLDSDKVFKLAKAQISADGSRDEELLSEVLALVRAAKSCGLVPRGAPMAKVGLVPDEQYVWEDKAFEKGFSLREIARDTARKVLLSSIKSAYAREIDFDDQIYMSTLFGGAFPRYHTVIVDEAQDLSPLNHIQLQRTTATRLIAIGDPYQAIYAFRGADSNSMVSLMELFPFERLGLTYSFRAPKRISRMQTAHVSDFKSWETCKEGTIEHWPLHDPEAPEVDQPVSWSIADVPKLGAILCRNNAPMMKLAFTLIRARRPVKILGRDIGASLASLLSKICAKQDLPVEAAEARVHDWYASELRKLENSESKLDTLVDRRESLLVLLEASDAKTSFEAVAFIKDLFADKAEGLVLSSGHRSKGLEWDWVMHLDPWRVPSKLALRAAENGNGRALVQEKNLKYVIETRTKDVLVLANLEDCEELGA